MKTAIICLFVLIVSACYQEQVKHGYVVVKSTSEYQHIHEFRPVIRVTYRIQQSVVISELAGLVEEYKDCEIIDLNNWECRYNDGTGFNKFGFTSGVYWKTPVRDKDIQYVSRWQYNVIRCKWYLHYNGVFKGLTSCVKTYI